MHYLLVLACSANTEAANVRKKPKKLKCKFPSNNPEDWDVLHPDLSGDKVFQQALTRLQPDQVPIFSVLTADALRGHRTVQFNSTASAWGLPFVPVGSYSCVWPKFGFRWLAKVYAEAMKQLAQRSPKQIAVVMDSQDAFVQGSADEIRSHLRATGKPLVLVLETGCAKKRCTTPVPRPGEESNSTKLVGIPDLLHINGGVVVGEAHALEFMWRFVANNTFTGNRMFHIHSAQHGIGKFVRAYPDFMAFDRTQAMAAVINTLANGKRMKVTEWTRYYDLEQLRLPRVAGSMVVRHRVVNKMTRRPPCVLHVPGTQEFKRHYDYMNETMRAWDEISSTLAPPSVSTTKLDLPLF